MQQNRTTLYIAIAAIVVALGVAALAYVGLTQGWYRGPEGEVGAQGPAGPTTEVVQAATAIPAQVVVDIQKDVNSGSWEPYDSAGGIPYNGTAWNVDVAPDELEIFTAGPACIAGVCLPGGETRGSIIILLPGAQVIHYEVTGVIAGSNWHGSYRPLGDPTVEATWRSLALDRIAAMQKAPNCTPGTGCLTIDVLVVGPGNTVVDKWTVTTP